MITLQRLRIDCPQDFFLHLPLDTDEEQDEFVLHVVRQMEERRHRRWRGSVDQERERFRIWSNPEGRQRLISPQISGKRYGDEAKLDVRFGFSYASVFILMLMLILLIPNVYLNFNDVMGWSVLTLIVAFFATLFVLAVRNAHNDFIDYVERVDKSVTIKGAP